MLVSDSEYQSQDKLLYISHSLRNGPSSMAANHFHGNYEIYCLLEGERYYFIKDGTYFVSKGDIVLIPPYQLHKTLDADSPQHERLLLYFEKECFSAIAGPMEDLLLTPFYSQYKVLHFSEENRTIVLNLAGRIVSEMHNKPVGFELQMKVLLMELLIFCTRNLSVKDSISTKSMPIYKGISEIVQYMNINYNKSLTLPMVSGEFFISPYYLSRKFKQTTGFTFVEYLNNVRVIEAQNLLRTTDWTVIRIAQETGFGNISHFGRVFKEISGVTPMAFRRKK